VTAYRYTVTLRKLRRLRKLANRGYFTILLPWSDLPTPWHPTEREGPFSVLSRGAFATRKLARDWAKEHLRPFHTFRLKHFKGGY
jgi:hypothetical protein